MKVIDSGLNNIVRIAEDAPPKFSDKFQVNINGSNNKIIFAAGVTGKRIIIDINGNNNRVLVGKNCVLNGSISAKSDGNTISIGKFTTIGGVRIECEYGMHISLGEDCMLSRDIVIRSGDSHSIIDLNTKKRINMPRSVRIGKHVWMGYGVNIGKGAIVQDNTVIGMGSYVNKMFLTGNVIIAGVPAKIVKENIVWDRRSLTNDVPESHINSLIDNYCFDESKLLTLE
ncbi:acyltransferase [Atlantibacter hermannii]|uniref:acyltransferase n=1 Tax=Atlantibacter hermannii TaxID=565 RepID=UPI0028B0B86C|nr:hypothetical protein [Atlantibacter hermannii]